MHYVVADIVHKQSHQFKRLQRWQTKLKPAGKHLKIANFLIKHHCRDHVEQQRLCVAEL